MKQKDIPITHISRARIKKQKWQIFHKRAKEIFKDKLKPKFTVEKKWERKMQTLFSRLRYNHANKEFRSYLYKIDVATDPFSECDKEQHRVETLEHLLCGLSPG